MSTGDGERFVRFWFEVVCGLVSFPNDPQTDDERSHKTWIVADKGGNYRRWYGNRVNVILWKNNGEAIKSCPKSAVRNEQYFFLPHISWTLVTSGIFSARLFDSGFLLDTASNCVYFTDRCDPMYGLALLNSTVAQSVLDLLNPTLNMSCGVVAQLPYVFDKKEAASIRKLTVNCIEESKTDWDSFETSWDFKKHPLI